MLSPPSFVTLKIINLIAFTLNTTIAFGIGVYGWFGFPNNGEISQRYPTLVTPIGSTFSIWSIIYLSELLFVMVPFLVPRLISNHSHLVQDGIGWYFSIGVCLGQIAWTFAFANSIMWLGMLLLVVVLISLIQIVQRQYSIVTAEQQNRNDDEDIVCCCPGYEYGLLQFPFRLHCGWILVATLLQFNICMTIYSNEMLQYVCAILTLLVVTLVAFLQLWFFAGDLTIPLVLAWAANGISEQLLHPSNAILSTFVDDQIDGIFQFATVGTLFILLGIAVSIACRRQKEHQQRRQQRHSNYAIRDDEAIPILLG